MHDNAARDVTKDTESINPSIMICPKCKTNLEGDLIYETFLAKYGDERKALETAKMYGATKTEGRWGRQIGIYDRNRDRTVAYRCPDCGHEWQSVLSS